MVPVKMMSFWPVVITANIWPIGSTNSGRKKCRDGKGVGGKNGVKKGFLVLLFKSGGHLLHGDD